jgi:fucose 4-O-acetylase-like acetyltransferase
MDIARGLGILLVVRGHNPTYSSGTLAKTLIALGMQSLVILVFHYFVQQEVHYLMAEAGTQQKWLVIIVFWTGGVLIPVLLYLLLLKRIPWVCTGYRNPKGQI